MTYSNSHRLSSVDCPWNWYFPVRLILRAGRAHCSLVRLDIALHLTQQIRPPAVKRNWLEGTEIASQPNFNGLAIASARKLPYARSRWGLESISIQLSHLLYFRKSSCLS